MAPEDHPAFPASSQRSAQHGGPRAAARASAKEPIAFRPMDGQFSLGGATGWLSSPPMSMPGLRGRVVLINIWTYTCINWLRSLPHIRAWDAFYRGHGLVTI